MPKDILPHSEQAPHLFNAKASRRVVLAGTVGIGTLALLGKSDEASLDKNPAELFSLKDPGEFYKPTTDYETAKCKLDYLTSTQDALTDRQLFEVIADTATVKGDSPRWGEYNTSGGEHGYVFSYDRHVDLGQGRNTRVWHEYMSIGFGSLDTFDTSFSFGKKEAGGEIQVRMFDNKTKISHEINLSQQIRKSIALNLSDIFYSTKV